MSVRSEPKRDHSSLHGALKSRIQRGRVLQVLLRTGLAEELGDVSRRAQSRLRAEVDERQIASGWLKLPGSNGLNGLLLRHVVNDVVSVEAYGQLAALQSRKRDNDGIGECLGERGRLVILVQNVETRFIEEPTSRLRCKQMRRSRRVWRSGSRHSEDRLATRFTT